MYVRRSLTKQGNEPTITPFLMFPDPLIVALGGGEGGGEKRKKGVGRH